MKKIRFIDLISVDGYSITAKYLQIANSVIREIENGNIQIGDNMPSINELSNEIGEQVEIISYNETPLKKIILNGITTISTDFHQMGIIAAELILSNSKEHIEVPFKLTLRDSL